MRVAESICSNQLPYQWHGHAVPAGGTGADTLFLHNTAGCDSLVILDLTMNATVWTTYTPITSGLANENVRSVAVDAAGNKWFGMSGGGVSKFDGTTWTTYNSGNSPLMNYISDAAIRADAAGNVWVGTQGTGVEKFDGTAWTAYTTSNSGIAGNLITGLDIDMAGNVWLGTYGNGVSKFDGTTWTNYMTGLALSTLEAVACDPDGRVWVSYGTGGGVSVFNGTTWTTYTTSNSGLVSNGVGFIRIDADGNKWFCTDAGISKFDGTTWTSYTTSNSGLAGNYVPSMDFDPLGNAWICTSGGVSKFDGTTWTTFSSSNSGLFNSSITDVAVDPATGDIWISHSGYGGVSRFSQPCQLLCAPTTGVDVQTACGSFTWIDGVTYMASNTTAQYILISGNAAGCDSTVTLNLTINTLPDLSIATAFSNCASIDLDTIIIADAASTNATFEWFTDAACTTPVADPNNVTVSATYYAVGTAASCSDTVSTVITINTLPDLSIATGFSNCASINLDTITIADAASTNAAFEWFTDATCTTPVADPNNVTVSATYYAVGTTSSCSDTVSTVITINARPDLSIAPGFSNCVSIDLDTITIADAAATNAAFEWFTNAACTIPVADPNNVSVSATYYAAGTTASCSDTVSTVITITPALEPEVSITATPGAVFIPGQQITFTALATDAGPSPSFTWMKNGTPISGAPATNVYITSNLLNGDHISCIVHSNAPCAAPVTATSNAIAMSSALGLASIDMATSVNIFPNPANETVHILIESAQNYPDVEFLLTDLSGRAVITQTGTITAGKQQFEINTLSLPGGVYQLHITLGDNRTITRKVVLQ